MDINDIVARTGGLQTMARDLGASESQARSGVAALLPAILGGFEKLAQAPSSGRGLASMVDFDGDGNPLDDILQMAGKLRK